MRRRMTVFTVCLLLVTVFLRAGDAWDVDIPYEKFILDNGLTLLVHEDHKAPIVAVNVWYHVGSKNEVQGKTGFAHLFEHLMFNGSENMDDDYFQTMEAIGATDLNGTTSEDRTNYFENVPVSAFDIALWMESDRMGHMIGAITQDKLDEQRGVVQNEKRQYENQPYAVSYELITHNTFPKGHPYSWTVIGSMDDLDAASLEDVHTWFKTYYGAANATVVVAGDITPEAALEKVKKYFGDVPPGPPIARHDVWVAKRNSTHRMQVQDRVPQARLYRVWNVPQWGSADTDYLDMVANVLTTGKNSRLYKRLVYEDQIATDVNAYVDAREIAGLFQIEVTAKPGMDLGQIEKTVDEELQKLLKTGPTKAELERIKAQYIAGFIRGIERIGGFGGKSDILAQNMVFGGSPDAYKTTLQRKKNATTEDLHRVANAWLSKGDLILHLTPYPELAARESDVDRSQLPAQGEAPEAAFPAVQRGKLSNGLEIVLAERHDIPVVDFTLMVDAGYASDQFASPGTARLAMDMLDEGTKKRNALAISQELDMLGADLGTGSNLDVSAVSLNTLKMNLDAALDIYADVILNPVFPKADFERLQKQQLARIQREKVTPIQMALRVYSGILYGKDHAYGLPMTGSGSEKTVAALTREDLIKFHETWFRPNNASIIVVGDIRLAEIQPKLEKLFQGWKSAEVPVKNIGKVDQKPEQEIYILDRPGSQQSIIFAGHVAPPKANPEEEAMNMLNNILGGDFTSRINMNLREDKHWTYGAGSFLWDAQGQRPFLTYTSVQSDKTSEAIQEIQKEFSGIITGQPPTEQEFKKVQENELLKLPGTWETIGSVAGSVGDIVRFGMPDDYYQKYPAKVKNMTLNDVAGSAKTLVKPGHVVWVVVGDRSQIEAPLRELNCPTHIMDADGNILE
ncbi:insulinase family protein [bacterium]|nr:insulinase family protein [bacterium]